MSEQKPTQKTIMVKWEREVEDFLEEHDYEYSVENFLVLPEIKAVPNATQKIEIELPSIYEPFFEYLKRYFWLNTKEYLEKVLTREIESRNSELGIF